MFFVAVVAIFFAVARPLSLFKYYYVFHVGLVDHLNGTKNSGGYRRDNGKPDHWHGRHLAIGCSSDGEVASILPLLAASESQYGVVSALGIQRCENETTCTLLWQL
jgi:hypothetical protein